MLAKAPEAPQAIAPSISHLPLKEELSAELNEDTTGALSPMQMLLPRRIQSHKLNSFLADFDEPVKVPSPKS